MENYLNKFDFKRIHDEAPVEEPARQNYYIKAVRQILKARFDEMAASGEALEQYGKEQLDYMFANNFYGTCHIQTFGCPKVTA